MERLIEDNVVRNKEVLTINTVGLVYGDGMRYTFGDCVCDNISLSAEILTELGAIWRQRISDEIEKCEKVAESIGRFSDQVCDVIYGTDKNKKGTYKDQLIQRFYFTIDKSFREWLMSIDPSVDDIEIKMEQWEHIAYIAGRKIVDEHITSMGETIYRVKTNEKRRMNSVPGIYNQYLLELKGIYPKCSKTKSGVG